MGVGRNGARAGEGTDGVSGGTTQGLCRASKRVGLSCLTEKVQRRGHPPERPGTPRLRLGRRAGPGAVAGCTPAVTGTVTIAGARGRSLLEGLWATPGSKGLSQPDGSPQASQSPEAGIPVSGPDGPGLLGSTDREHLRTGFRGSLGPSGLRPVTYPLRLQCPRLSMEGSPDHLPNEVRGNNGGGAGTPDRGSQALRAASVTELSVPPWPLLALWAPSVGLQ